MEAGKFTISNPFGYRDWLLPECLDRLIDECNTGKHGPVNFEDYFPIGWGNCIQAKLQLDFTPTK